MPAQTTEFVDTATGDDAKLDRQPVGRADCGHAAATALGREDRTEFGKRRHWERGVGFGPGTTAIARAQAALGRIAGHSKGHGKGKQRI